MPLIIAGYTLFGFGATVAVAKTIGYLVTKDPVWLH